MKNLVDILQSIALLVLTIGILITSIRLDEISRETSRKINEISLEVKKIWKDITKPRR